MVKKESKHALFLRLAKPRTQKALDALRILGNCSDKHRYEYSQEEIDKIFSSLKEYITHIENKFNGVKLEQDNFNF